MTPTLPLRVLLADDEAPARQRLEDLLSREPDVEVVASCADGFEAIDAIRDEQPDLVFLDVQMPECTGLEVVKRIGPAQMPIVVFITAFHDHAVKAFEVNALDYLLKPFEDERFRHTLERAREQRRLRQADALTERLSGLLKQTNTELPDNLPLPRRYLDRIPVRERDRTLFIMADAIDYITADGPYARLHVGGRTHLIRERMHVLENELDPTHFVRIHRSTIVRLDRVHALQSLANGEYIVRLDVGAELKVSRGRREIVQQRLGVV